MQRAAMMIAILVAACGDGGSSPDDASSPVDSSDGSGSNATSGIDPSPPDVTLQWIVVGLSTIVVIGAARSRRRDAKLPEI